MGEVVNLRLIRKRKARSEREAEAEQSRARHGRTKAERLRDSAAAGRETAFLDGHRRERVNEAGTPKPPPGSDD